MAQGQQSSNITSLYTDLNRTGQNGEYERALKIANKILQQSADEEKAFHCKIVCLIQLGKFEEALTAIHKNNKLSGNLTFEKAYCEYRLNRSQEALRTLQNVSEPDYRIQELLSQVLYRLEEYGECLDVYKKLMKNTHDDYEEERMTNLSAVLAALQTTTDEPVEDLGLREDTYELAYNRTCYLIGKEDYQEACNKLTKAEELCRESFEDDTEVTEDEIDSELGVIRVQKGYVLQRLGRTEEAMKLYNQVLKQKPSDAALAAVASNNIITLNKDQNVFDSKKKIKVATSNGLQQKLTSQQKQAISMNQCLLYMYTNQGDQCHRTAVNLQERYPDSDSPSLIQAAQYHKDKQLDKAIASLEAQIARRPGNNVSLRLTLAQLYLGQGSVYQACDTLRKLGDLTYRPGVVSALVTLYTSQEDTEAAAEVLTEAVDWYKVNKPNSEELVQLMRSSANLQLRNGNAQDATAVLEELRKRDPQDLRTLAQLISAYSKFDPKKAQAVSRELPSPEELAHDVDVEALEAAAGTLGPRYIKKTTKTEQSPTKPQSPGSGVQLLQKKQKKKRKGKLPKNCEGESTPDPERWLPRRERSYYKGKRRDKRKEIGKGTQGAASNVPDLDASKTASPSGSEVGSPRPGTAAPPSGGNQAAATPSSAPGPRQQKPQGAKNKKKKKGNKW